MDDMDEKVIRAQRLQDVCLGIIERNAGEMFVDGPDAASFVAGVISFTGFRQCDLVPLLVRHLSR